MPKPRAFAVLLLSATTCAPPLPSPAEPPPVRLPDWSASIQSSITAGEYAPRPIAGGYRVTNRAEDLRGNFSDRGLTVTRRDGTDEVTLALRAWGREDTTIVVDNPSPEEGPCLSGGAVDAFGDCLRRIDYVRPGIVEWWENRPEGLEQGFTVTAPPEGEGALVFELEIDGAIVEVEEEGDAALLVPAAGDPLRFAGLAAWDERGRTLPAWMEETEDGLRIVVDDTGAVGVVTVDPILTTAAWMVESDQAYAWFGYSVASAGDVNGDGYSDVLVGASCYDNGSTDEGAVFVYLGSASGLSTTAAWTAESDQPSARFGLSVASARDVNGDGYGDVVVGAPYYPNGDGDEGTAFVYLGSVSGLSTSPAWTVESDQSNAGFGYSVASAGDVNGDGYGDVAVGAPGYDGGAVAEGAAFVYLGSASGLATEASWSAESDSTRALFGNSVASAGDVNGDGYGDVVVGAFGYYNPELYDGAAFVYLGSASGLSTSAAWAAKSDQAEAFFGISVASAGDVNGDGYGDVVVGAAYYDNGSTNEGAAFVYLGSASGLATGAAWTAESDQAGAGLGGSVASAGDVNEDGYGDLVMGAAGYDNGSSGGGAAFIYLGSGSGLAARPAWSAGSDQAGVRFGISVAAAGDVNGDGHGDLVVGADSYPGGARNEGAAFVFLFSGGATFDADSDGYDNGANDCNDTNSAINPGADEVCNGLDDDCDGNVDEDCVGADATPKAAEACGCASNRGGVGALLVLVGVLAIQRRRQHHLG